MELCNKAEQLEQQRQAIRHWKPWEQSTGPVSAEGKGASSGNARQADSMQSQKQELKLLRKLLRDCGES